MDSILDWYLALPRRRALRAVGLHTSSSNTPELIARFLSTLENSLEYLFITTLFVSGMSVIFLTLSGKAACLSRIPVAVRPTLPHKLTLALNSARQLLEQGYAGGTDALTTILTTD
jgi:hypothetical protein